MESEKAPTVIQESLFNLEDIQVKPGNDAKLVPGQISQGVLTEKYLTGRLYDLFQMHIWTSDSLVERKDLKNLRNRVSRDGVQTLSNGELLTLVLSTEQGSEGVLERMRQLFEHHSFKELMQMDIGELLRKHRLGEAKSVQLLSLLEIARRLTIPSTDEKYQIRSPADAARLVIPEMAYLDHEVFRVLLLDTKNCVVENRLLYKGTVNSSVVRTPEVFRHAIIRNCPGIIVFHNHPSGSTEPSQEDIAVTNALVEAGKLFEIDLIDHIIIGWPDKFLSLRERIAWK